jgi:hypothetical protein
MKPYIVGFISLLLLYYLFIGFLIWFKPDVFLKLIHASNVKRKKLFPFLPDWLIISGYYNEYAPVNRWWLKLQTFIWIFVCIIALVSTIQSDFSGYVR